MLFRSIVYSSKNVSVDANAVNIQLENVANGIYFVEVTDGMNVFVQHLNIVK